MKKCALPIAVLLAAFTLITQPSASAGLLTSSDTFGTSGHEFTIDFVNIGNAGNAADTTGYGAVPYEYRVSTYAISQDAITKATNSGMSTNVTAGAWEGNRPAANISWYEAAAFVNWLNTSTGYQAAYKDLTFSGGSWSMELWSSADAWQLGGENLYRHKDAQYFLPSEDEWYKAAYYNPGGVNYFDYPTGSDTAPTAVASGTNAGTAVYSNATNAPAQVSLAGGLSPYGTMGQGGNVWEWNETAYDGTNSSGSEKRVFRGGYWSSAASELQSSYRDLDFPSYQINSVGFRVASAQPAAAVPEPGTWAAAALLAVGAAFVRWRKRTGSNRSPERPGARG